MITQIYRRFGGSVALYLFQVHLSSAPDGQCVLDFLSHRIVLLLANMIF